MYQRCKTHNIPYKQTGKLVVARKDQLSYIEKLHKKSLELKAPTYTPLDGGPVLPTELLSGAETRDMEPDLSPAIVGSLWSPSTGIVDSYSFMRSLEKDIQDSEGGQLVCGTRVVRIDPYKKSTTAESVPDTNAAEDGWVVQTSSEEELYTIFARNLINAAGLGSTLVLNSILPREKRIPMYFAKGSYASYHGPGTSKVSHLIYPCREVGPNAHAFESLGTHLTLDLQGNIRFGPDLEWIEPPEADIKNNEDDIDFWTKRLVPDKTRLPEMHKAVTSYLPGISFEGLQAGYCGIRPKLIPPGGGFQDFLFRTDYPSVDAERNRSCPMVSLLGIESPGLTSSLAIAERVIDVLRKEV
jgi:L-2-hydroxyglutarate oxidase LhgO